MAIMGLLVQGVVNGQDENLRVIDKWLKYTDAPNALYHHFYTQAKQHLDKRSAEVAKLQTKADWQKRQETVRKTLLEIVGPFPEKTPLNAKIVETIQKDGYHVEKIISLFWIGKQIV